MRITKYHYLYDLWNLQLGWMCNLCNTQNKWCNLSCYDKIDNVIYIAYFLYNVNQLWLLWENIFCLFHSMLMYCINVIMFLNIRKTQNKWCNVSCYDKVDNAIDSIFSIQCKPIMIIVWEYILSSQLHGDVLSHEINFSKLMV